MATKTKAAKGGGVGDAAVAAIRSGLDNDAALAAVKKKFPKSSVSISSIAWYRNKLRSDGEKGVKTSRDIKKAARAAEKSKSKSKK